MGEKERTLKIIYFNWKMNTQQIHNFFFFLGFVAIIQQQAIRNMSMSLYLWIVWMALVSYIGYATGQEFEMAYVLHCCGDTLSYMCVALFRKKQQHYYCTQCVIRFCWDTSTGVFPPALIEWTDTLCCHVNNCWVSSRTQSQITADSLRRWGKPLMIVDASLAVTTPTMTTNRLKMNTKNHLSFIF